MNDQEDCRLGREDPFAASEAWNDVGLRILEEIILTKSCCLSDDVRWNDTRGCFEGSFLWHGIPTSLTVLNAFADFAVCTSAGTTLPDVVAGISSSGVAWATAAALRINRPLGVLRLTRHHYGANNADLRRFRGGRAWLIDNFVGSGDTIREAQDTLEKFGLRTVQTLVLEGAEACQVSVAIRTEAKLRELVRREYFSDLGREVVRRYLAGKRRGLEDVAWVRTVRARLAQIAV